MNPSEGFSECRCEEVSDKTRSMRIEGFGAAEKTFQPCQLTGNQFDFCHQSINFLITSLYDPVCPSVGSSVSKNFLQQGGKCHFIGELDLT